MNREHSSGFLGKSQNYVIIVSRGNATGFSSLIKRLSVAKTIEWGSVFALPLVNRKKKLDAKAQS